MSVVGGHVAARVAAVVAAVACVLASPASAAAAPGDLDTSFGTSGTALTPIGSGGDSAALAAAPTPDGGYVAAGRASDGGAQRMALARYNGSGGVVWKAIVPLGQTTAVANAVVVQPDGSIVVAGYGDDASGNTDVALARYTASGQLDSSFGNGGTELLPEGNGGDSAAEAVAVQGSDLAVAGRALNGGQTELLFVRLPLSSGTPASSVTLQPLGDGGSAEGNAIAIDSQGRAVVAGDAEQNASKAIVLARFTASGGLDGSFGSGGTLVQPVPGDGDARAVTVEPSGRIVTSGGLISNGSSRLLVAGFTPNGTGLDTTFGSGGAGFTAVNVGDGGNAFGSALARTPGGELAVAGTAADKTKNKPLVARFSAGGALDASFGPASAVPGTVLSDCDADASAGGVAVGSDGRITIAGGDGPDSAHQQFLLARYVDAQATGTGRCGGGAPSGGGPGGGTGGTGSGGCAQLTRSIGPLAVRGCLKLVPPRVIATGQLDVDGVTLSPSPCTSIVFDSVAGTIKSVCNQGGPGSVGVSVAAPGLGAVPLYQGKIDWTIPTGGYVDIAEFDAGSLADLKGFPLAGKIDVKLAGGGVDVAVNAALPAPFNAVTGSATLRADLEQGLHLDTLEIKAAQIPLGPVAVKNFDIKYTASTDTWYGSAAFVIPTPEQYTAQGDATFVSGRFNEASVSIDNLNVAIAPAVFLQNIGFEVVVKPLELRGVIGVSAGPKILNVAAVAIGGDLAFFLPDSGGWSFLATGTMSLVNVTVAHAYLEYFSDGVFEIGGHVSVGSCPDVCIDGDFGGGVYGQGFWLTGKAEACFAGLCPNVAAAISNKGVAACITLGGIGYDWGASGPFFFAGCDLSSYVPAHPQPVLGSSVARARVAAAGGVAVAVRPGQRLVGWRVTGAGGQPPQLQITGPAGETYQTGAAAQLSGGALLYEDAATATTYVVISHPRAGRWTLTPLGGTLIGGVDVAYALPAPRVAASVRGAGRTRVLRWRLRPIAGQQVELLERGPSVDRLIARVSRADGELDFQPAPGPHGRREIVAIVLQGGLPRASIEAGSYIAPPPPRPAAIRGLRAGRVGDALTLAWRPVASAADYLISVRSSGGARVLELVGRPAATIAGIERIDGAVVTVRARSAQGLAGQPAQLRLSQTHPPAPRRAPRIAGRARVGGSLSCTRGTWSGQPTRYVFEWLRGEVPIAHATQPRLRVTRADRGHELSCAVTARNAAGAVTGTTQGLRVR